MGGDGDGNDNIAPVNVGINDAVPPSAKRIAWKICVNNTSATHLQFAARNTSRPSAKHDHTWGILFWNVRRKIDSQFVGSKCYNEYRHKL
jgi:hypothetical protein